MQKSFSIVAVWLVASSYAWGAINHLVEITPMVGGNFHINKNEYETSKELAAGLRFGLRTSANTLIELGFEYLPHSKMMNHHNANNHRYFGNYINEFDVNSFLSPYILVGLGYERIGIPPKRRDNGMDNDAFSHVGIGTRFIVSKWMHLKAEVRDVIVFDGRNDLVASVGFSIPFGKPSKGQLFAANNALNSPLTPQPAPSTIPTPAESTGPMRLSNPSAGIKGQKHQGEGFMEGYGQTSKSTSNNIQVGDIIQTDEGRHEVTKTVTLSLPDVRFAFDSYDVGSMFEPQIQEFADSLLDSKTSKALLEGHTDWIGTDSYNLKLSRNRANAVKEKLMEFGIEESRIGVRAYGKSRPIADNTTAKGRAQNRRVEMILIKPLED